MADKRKWSVWVLKPGETVPSSGPWTWIGPDAGYAAERVVEWMIHAKVDYAMAWIDNGPIRVNVRENGNGPLWEFVVTAKMELEVVATEWVDDDEEDPSNG